MKKVLIISLAMALLISGPALAAKDELRIYIRSEYMDEEDRNNPAIYPSPEVMDKLFYLKDPGANMKLLDQAWTRIKAN
jgi:spermidine/putrescine-binding protein